MRSVTETLNPTSVDATLHLSPSEVRALVQEMLNSDDYSLEEKEEIKKWEQAFLSKKGIDTVRAICFFFYTWIFPLHEKNPAKTAARAQKIALILSQLSPQSTPQQTLRDYMALKNQIMIRGAQEQQMEAVTKVFGAFFNQLNVQANAIHESQVQQGRELHAQAVTLIRGHDQEAAALRVDLLNENLRAGQRVESLEEANIRLVELRGKLAKDSVRSQLQSLVDQLL